VLTNDRATGFASAEKMTVPLALPVLKNDRATGSASAEK
jgi:hypothetical protein